MRKQILGATAALVGAGALTLGLPTAPTQAAAWKTMYEIPYSGGNASEIEVVSTGDGDAVAAAIIDGAVHAFMAYNGSWTDRAVVTEDVDATGLVLASNGTGDVAVGWEEQDANGDYRLRVARKFATVFPQPETMTPAGTDVVGTAELGVTGNGRVIVAATVDGDDVDNKLVVTEWPKYGEVTTPKVLSPGDAWNPSLDVNAKGEAVLAYTYTGLIDNVLSVHHRSAAGAWNIGDSTDNDGNIAASADVAISDNGEGQVIYAVVKNGFYVAETARVKPNGVVLPGEFVSPLNEYVYEPSVDINAEGSALFTWITKTNGLVQVRYAGAANASYPSGSTLLPGAAAINTSDPTARISDSGLRLIQYSGSSYVTTHHRVGTVQPYTTTHTTNGFGADHAVDVDDEGNAIMAAHKPNDALYGRFLDASGPEVTLKAMPVNTMGTSVNVSWTMSDSLSSIKGTDVYATSAKWNAGAHTDPVVVANDVPASQTDVAVVPGTTYCYQVRPIDSAGNGSTSNQRCTTVPLDDKALLGDGWNRADESGNFRDTLSTTTKQGRVLTRTGVKAKRLALVVRKTANSGSVRVTFDGNVLGTYNLEGTGKRKVVNLGTFQTLRAGTLTIKVTSPDGKYVGIDGLLVAK